MSAQEGERGPVTTARGAVESAEVGGIALADMIKNAATTAVRSVMPDSPQEHRLDMAVRTALPAELAGADLAGFANLTQAGAGRKRLTIQEILDRRAKAGRLVAGLAAASNTDMFKGPSVGKPKAKRWDHLLTAESAAREPCKLKLAAKNMKKPGLLSLGGGLPSAEAFPFDSLTMRVPRPPHFDEAATRSGGLDARIGKYTAREEAAAGDDDKTGTSTGPAYDLSIALNYAQSNGSPQLNRWVAEHTELCFRPPYADWHASLTIGSTGALEQTMRMLCDGTRGDAILTEEFTFATMLETAAPLGINVVGAAMDEQGLLPESVDAILSNWDRDPRAARGVRRPHVLYTVPSGQNPTGATQGLQRRRDIYAVAQKHDLYIIEDEPYYFLQMEPYVEKKGEERKEAGGDGAEATAKSLSSPTPAPAAATATAADGTGSIDRFLDSLVPSLLSLDVDGRVLRMDSFAKVLAPGLRLGWVTGSEQVIERLVRHNEVCSQGPSGLSQAVLYKLLDQTWGHDGYLRWLMHIRTLYTARRDVLLAACEKYLPRDIVSWTPPAAGMFHWIRLDHTKHPQASSRSLVAIEEEIYNRCIENGVLVVCGSWFWTEKDTPPTAMFFRASYASARPEDMTEAIRRLGETIRQTFGLERASE